VFIVFTETSFIRHNVPIKYREYRFNGGGWRLKQLGGIKMPGHPVFLIFCFLRSYFKKPGRLKFSSNSGQCLPIPYISKCCN